MFNFKIAFEFTFWHLYTLLNINEFHNNGKPTGLEESGNPVFALNMGTVPATIAKRRAAIGFDGSTFFDKTSVY